MHVAGCCVKSLRIVQGKTLDLVVEYVPWNRRVLGMRGDVIVGRCHEQLF